MDTITQEDCDLILSRINANNPMFKSHTIYPMPTKEGLIGQHYKLKIQYEEKGVEKELNLFLKVVVSASEVLQYMITSIKAYEKEEFFYNYLTEKFSSCNISVDFAPKCYLCRPALFVFQDISLEGYKNSPSKNMLDVRHCKVALKTLAKFHASAIVYEKIKSNSQPDYEDLSKTHPEYLDDVLMLKSKTAAAEWLEATVKGLMNLIDLLPISEITPEEYKTKLIEAMEASAEPSPHDKNTILHGDLWSNNFMFKYENELPVDSILIDYQILKYGPMASDVVHMVMTNVRRSLRNIHYEELLSYYYHQFAEACQYYGFEASDFISYMDFMQSCEEMKIVGKMVCVADHSITFLIDEVVSEYFTSDEKLRNFFFGEKGASMVLSYERNDLYREIMTEDLIELRDLLFNK